MRFESVNVRAGPGLEYRGNRRKVQGQRCDIIGRNADSTWWQIRCADGTIGWISNDVVLVTGDMSSVPVVAAPPPPPPPPTPTPLPPSSGAWQ